MGAGGGEPLARLQLGLTDGRAVLVACRGGVWLLEAIYD